MYMLMTYAKQHHKANFISEPLFSLEYKDFDGLFDLTF